MADTSFATGGTGLRAGLGTAPSATGSVLGLLSMFSSIAAVTSTYGLRKNLKNPFGVVVLIFITTASPPSSSFAKRIASFSVSALNFLIII